VINVFGANLDNEELQEIKSSLDSSWMGMGEKVSRFETALAQRNNLLGLTMVDSGSNALYLAIRLLNIERKKIIVPSFTWTACANAVLLAGYEVIFADVDYNTQNITEKTVAQVITKDVGAIMAVHYAGKPCNMKRLKTFGVPVIEDAAHAIDSKIDDTYCGNLGEIAIYSFDSVKNLPTPEGGAIVGKKEYTDLAKEYRYCGMPKSGFSNVSNKKWWETKTKHIAPKMLPNDICASVGLSQLKKLDTHQKRRKEIWNKYQESFNNLLKPADPESNEQHSYFTYLIRVKSRDALAHHLYDNGIYTTLRYHPLHLNEIYNCTNSLPVCEKLNEEGLNLPLHPALSDNDVDKIIELVKDHESIFRH
jgi:dTDP-4-amino-4,6-dideoxygalactose transaminase